MTDGRTLAEAIWPAINVEMMHSQAWCVCFSDEFRHDHYRQIAHVVFFKAATSSPCILGELRAEIADAFQIDDKTVADRIERMRNNNLLALSRDKNDRRRRLVTPTDALVASYKKFSDHVVDLQIEFRKQLDKRDRPRRIHKPTPALYFDLLEHVATPVNGDRNNIDNAALQPHVVEGPKVIK
jgi:DNA-binding MarR family transcriptional regulator